MVDSPAESPSGKLAFEGVDTMPTRPGEALIRLNLPVLLALCTLSLMGAALSPHFLRPDFPETRLEQWLPGLMGPVGWSALHALGAMLVTGLLWAGTDLVAAETDSPRLHLAMGLQGLAFALVFLAGSMGSLVLALVAAGLGNLRWAAPLRDGRLGPAAALLPGGGVTLTLLGGLLAQGRATEVGVLSALALGLLAAATALVREFSPGPGSPGRRLPDLVGEGPAMLISLGLVSMAHLLTLGLLVQRVGIQREVLLTLGPAMGAQLYLLSRAAGDPAWARRAELGSATIFLGVTAVYVGTQALY